MIYLPRAVIMYYRPAPRRVLHRNARDTNVTPPLLDRPGGTIHSRFARRKSVFIVIEWVFITLCVVCNEKFISTFQYRCALQGSISLSLSLFLYFSTFLSLSRWHRFSTSYYRSCALRLCSRVCPLTRILRRQ